MIEGWGKGNLRFDRAALQFDKTLVGHNIDGKFVVEEEKLVAFGNRKKSVKKKVEKYQTGSVIGYDDVSEMHMVHWFGKDKDAVEDEEAPDSDNDEEDIQMHNLMMGHGPGAKQSQRKQKCKVFAASHGGVKEALASLESGLRHTQWESEDEVMLDWLVNGRQKFDKHWKEKLPPPLTQP
jgi:hypothetical protein